MSKRAQERVRRAGSDAWGRPPVPHAPRTPRDAMSAWGAASAVAGMDRPPRRRRYLADRSAQLPAPPAWAQGGDPSGAASSLMTTRCLPARHPTA